MKGLDDSDIIFAIINSSTLLGGNNDNDNDDDDEEWTPIKKTEVVKPKVNKKRAIDIIISKPRPVKNLNDLILYWKKQHLVKHPNVKERRV